MKILNTKYNLLLILSLALFACRVNKIEPRIEQEDESISNFDLANSALRFSQSVLQENLIVKVHKRLLSNYLDIQMIFEADDWKSDHFNCYTSYSNKLNSVKIKEENYNGSILIVATYKDEKSAEHSFKQIKSNIKTRIKELEGFAGLIVEQVQIFERIRKFGGLLTQKDKYVYYLVKNCEKPIVGNSWSEYENMFLKFITRKNEEIEIITSNCKKNKFIIKNEKASR